MRPTIKVKSILDSLDYVKARGASVARFGDGEIDLMTGKSIPYQDYDEELARRLKKILQTPSSQDLLVCLPDVFEGMERYNSNAQAFWQNHFAQYSAFYDATCQSDWYGSTFLSRPYIDLADKSQAATYFAALKDLWQDRDILIVEGETSRSGLGNDLFANAKSIKRLICPARNAYAHYEDIRQLAHQEGQGRLILTMLGPTAKLLAVDLMLLGHQAIDLGHIDSEYEWFLMGADHKVKLGHKHTAEHNYDSDVAAVTDRAYLGQIVGFVGVPPIAEPRDLISVIIPVYNVAAYLGRCLDSLLKQTYDTFEIILINDGSTDSSAQLALDYAQKDGRIKVYHQENAGPSAARNYGLELAQGDYITFVDGDDFVEPTYLEHLYQALVDTGSDISAVNFSGFVEESQTFLFYQTEETYFERVYSVQEWLDQEANMANNFHFVFTFSPLKLFKKELFDWVRYPEGRLREDDATMYKLYLAANQIAFRNEGSYFYSQRAEGLSRSSMLTDVESMVSNAEERIALLVSLGYDPTVHIQSYVSRLEKCRSDALLLGQMATYQRLSAKLALYQNHQKRE